jgi:hypothetical protein
VTRERSPWVGVTCGVTIGPAWIITARLRVLIRGFPVVARTATERPSVVIVGTGFGVGLPRVVIAAVRAADGSSAGRIRMPLVAARIVVARVEADQAAVRRFVPESGSVRLSCVTAV